MCAFGAFGDFIHRIAGRFVKFKINEKLDRSLKYVKYALLLFLIVAGWILGSKIFASANPWDAFGMVATLGQPINLGFVLENLAPAFILLLFIAAGSVFVERFFCRYLCPLGASFAILSRLRIIRIEKPNAKCGKCRICTGKCAMGIPLYKKSVIATGECIGCMKCVPACPRENVSVGIAGYDIRPLAASILTVAVVAGSYSIGNISPAEALGNTTTLEDAQITEQPAVASIIVSDMPAATAASLTIGASQSPAPQATPIPAQSPQPASLYKDGAYQGSGRGFRGTTTVQVTIRNDVVTNVKILSYRDDKQFFNTAYPVVINEILQTQSPAVDAVSGATYSSNGIMSAVADALGKARI
jgi:uncharacterized protein with FMN-binding domain